MKTVRILFDQLLQLKLMREKESDQQESPKGKTEDNEKKQENLFGEKKPEEDNSTGKHPAQNHRFLVGDVRRKN